MREALKARVLGLASSAATAAAPAAAMATARRSVTAQAPSPRRGVGHGKAFASFGEIVQGRRTDGEDFLITLPVDLWSRCRVSCEPCAGPSVVEAPLAKSRRVAEELLRVLGLASGVRLRIELRRDIPVGKGLSSSTADMLAVLRACQAPLGIVFGNAFISRLFAGIEPHDALHYPTSVVYNHRRGRLLDRLGYIPDFRIVAVDAGGEVCTETYNRRLDFSPTLIDDYQRLYQHAVAAFAKRDDAAIAHCALQATELHLARTSNELLRRLLERAKRMDVLGLLNTHSGTCGGFLLPGDADDDDLGRVRARLAGLGAVFHTRTLRIPP